MLRPYWHYSTIFCNFNVFFFWKVVVMLNSLWLFIHALLLVSYLFFRTSLLIQRLLLYINSRICFTSIYDIRLINNLFSLLLFLFSSSN